MFAKLKPELDAIFSNGAHYGQESLTTGQGVLYDTLMSELTDEFWNDLEKVLLKSGLAPAQITRFLDDFQNDLRLHFPYLSKIEILRPHFEEAASRAFPEAEF